MSVKGVAITVLAAGITVVGGRAAARSYVGEPSGTAASGSASTPGKGGCWSPTKIKTERYTLRGIAGSIRSFKVNAVEGCTFRVEVELDKPDGSSRTLDYMADFSAGERPIFVRYNTPP